MRRLILLRHAKSDWPAGVEDHDRPLSKRGQRDAPRMARELIARDLVPDLMLVSTARRTRETFALANAEFGDVPVRFQAALYDASPEAILAAIRSVPPEVKTLLVIGHNPGMEITGPWLAGEPGLGLLGGGEKFPTAAAMVIAFDEASWEDIAPGRGRLLAFLKPRDLSE